MGNLNLLEQKYKANRVKVQEMHVCQSISFLSSVSEMILKMNILHIYGHTSIIAIDRH